MTRLETPRLVLTSWRSEDAGEAFALWGDPEVMRFVGNVHENAERSRAAIEAAIDAEARDGVCLWRLRRRDGEPLGCCGFHVYDGPGSRRAGTRWLELAYHLRPAGWGQGYATEAASACLTYARARGWTHVVAFTAEGNHASRQVLDKLGLSPDGVEEEQTRHLLVLQSPVMAAAESLEALVDEMLADGKLTREELARFEAEMLADGQLSIEERRQIDRLLQAITNGEVTIVEP